jgi:hypothetical protein
MWGIDVTKRQRLHNLEERIGQLEFHIRKDCDLPMLDNAMIANMKKWKLDGAIAERLAWLRANNEKERMGRSRY